MTTRQRLGGAGEAHRGVVVLDVSGNVMLAAGIASNRQLAARIQRGWEDAQRQRKRVFAVDVTESQAVVVVAFQSAENTVLIAAQRDGRDTVVEFIASVDFAEDILRELLTNPFEALTVVDREGVLRYVSPIHERFFGITPGSAVGQHVTQVIENTRLHEVAATGKAEIGALQQMRGVSRIVSRIAVHDPAGVVVGAIGQVMFKGPEQLQAMSEELTKLRSEVAFYRRELKGLRDRTYSLDHIVGDSAAMRQLKHQIVKVAPLDVPVLLTGESGTGKELAAHAIHMLSARRDANLVMVNAAAMPATLVETELFGYEAGAFTGAERKGRRGKIEQADRGSLFLDEVGDMPAQVQVKLLRVLQDGRFERVGSHEPQYSSFRLISASNRNFEDMIAEGTFRLDLFYRIGGVTIRLPSLRERLDDVPKLAMLALHQFAERHGHRPKRISDEAVAFLRRQSWPGNVRQLMHSVERAAIFSDAEVIEPHDFDGSTSIPFASLPFPSEMSSRSDAEIITKPPEAFETKPLEVKAAVSQYEEQLIRTAMERHRGNKKAVATELGISRSYLYKKLAQMGVD